MIRPFNRAPKGDRDWEDHRYFAKVETAKDKFRYFYTKAEWDAYRNKGANQNKPKTFDVKTTANKLANTFQRTVSAGTDKMNAGIGQAANAMQRAKVVANSRQELAKNMANNIRNKETHKDIIDDPSLVQAKKFLNPALNIAVKYLAVAAASAATSAFITAVLKDKQWTEQFDALVDRYIKLNDEYDEVKNENDELKEQLKNRTIPASPSTDGKTVVMRYQYQATDTSVVSQSDKDKERELYCNRYADKVRDALQHPERNEYVMTRSHDYYKDLAFDEDALAEWKDNTDRLTGTPDQRLYEDLEAANNTYEFEHGNKYYMYNCGFTAIAYDLRRRGYDVTALGNTDGTYVYEQMYCYDATAVKTYNAHSYHSAENFNEILGVYIMKPAVANSITSTVAKNLESQGPNARGIINVSWTTGSGHSMVWENDAEGHVHIYDAQTNQERELKTIIEKTCDVEYFRTDASEFNANVSNYVEKKRR